MFKKVEKTILGASSIIIFFGLVIVIYLAFSGKFEEWRDVQVRELIVCKSDDISNDNKGAQCSKVFQNKIEELYVCGQIETKKTSISNLTILVNKDRVKDPIFVTDIGDQFLNGQFCRKFTLPNDNQIGIYQINIYYFRTILSSIKFEIH